MLIVKVMTQTVACALACFFSRSAVTSLQNWYWLVRVSISTYAIFSSLRGAGAGVVVSAGFPPSLQAVMALTANSMSP